MLGLKVYAALVPNILKKSRVKGDGSVVKKSYCTINKEEPRSVQIPSTHIKCWVWLCMPAILPLGVEQKEVYDKKLRNGCISFSRFWKIKNNDHTKKKKKKRSIRETERLAVRDNISKL